MKRATIGAAVLCLCAAGLRVRADVFHMDPGLTSLQVVAVGNLGNEGEWSGSGVPGGFGEDRICGAVDHARTASASSR